MFEWDEANLRKLSAHQITAAEAEELLSNNPVLVYEQDATGEIRHVYYGETNRGRMLAVVITERAGRIRVVTAYDLDAGQKRDYLVQRAWESDFNGE